MSRFVRVLIVLAVISAAILVACGAAAPAATTAPQEVIVAQPPAQEVPAGAALPEIPAPEVGPAAEGGRGGGEAGVSGEIIYRTGPEQPAPLAGERLIIKDGNVHLLVEDTDVTIDGVMQVVSDLGGYVLSSRVWYQPWGDENYKYASITIGVPAEEFERAIRRLRALAIRVLDETSSGEDVTDQYVDLQSRLESLQATRARILEFLDRARTVQEALQVNEELAAVEQQIEEVQGRINYLSGRAAYSTITIQIDPELPEIVPTPTPTATLTPTPTRTPTPVPWDPSETFDSAKGAVTTLYHFAADLLIWIVVVVLPVLIPIGFLIWLGGRIARGRSRKPPRAPSSEA
jgi:hypothetical protein